MAAEADASASQTVEATDEPRAPRSSMHYVRRLARYALPYWPTIIGVFLVGAVITFNRYLRAYLVKPLADDVLMPSARGEVGIEALEPVLLEIALLLGSTLIIQPIAVFWRSYGSHWVVASARRDIDQEIAGRLLSAPLRAHHEGRRGDFLSRTLTDVHLATQALVLLLNEILLNVQLVIGGAIALFMASWQLALMTLVAVPPVLVVMTFFGGRVQKQSQRRQETQGDLSQRLVAILSGIKVIKAFQGQELEEDAYAVQTGKFLRRHMKVVWNGVAARALGELINPIVAVAVLGIGGWLLINKMWGIEIGTLGQFAFTLTIIYKPIKALIKQYPRMMESASGAARLFEILDLPGETVDRPDARQMNGLTHQISFRDVHFDYGDGPVLSGVDLEVAPGEVIAVVGRTGTGKSTLIDLVLRFHDPTAGAIEIDGIDLRDYARQSFLERVAVVTQEPFLFDVSVRENIRYGRPSATDEEVADAARAASAEDFILALPEGYDTPVGEFGLRLSGGQRQRLTIARAILADPSILVFDEATSALDARTEATVQAAIESLRGERTIFLVAHRLSTIRRADRIVVLENGRVAQTGTHDSLVAESGIYRELIGSQDPQAA